MEFKMGTIILKNIPDDLYALLKEAALAHRRSINSEIIMCLERTLRGQKLNPEAILKTARQIREITAEYAITNDEFTQAKRAGHDRRRHKRNWLSVLNKRTYRPGRGSL
jgi:plasmid stability protein